MFESITHRGRPALPQLALIAAVTAVAFAAQLVLFAGTVAKPLAVAVGGMHAPPAAPAALPELEEEILVVAPYRPARVLHARAVPWRDHATWAAPRYPAPLASCPDR